MLTQQAYLQNKLNQQRNNQIHIAFLGMLGSYSNLAARQYAERYQKELIELSCESFRQVFTVVEDGKADYGVLPLENTTSGSINDVYDLLQHTDLHLVGELTYPIQHCVLISTPTDLAQIDTLYSHPQVIQQCSQFINSLQGYTLNIVKVLRTQCSWWRKLIGRMWRHWAMQKVASFMVCKCCRTALLIK